ncbi:MAG: alkaline phosphatase family protein [Aeromicrobium sp.]
MRLFRFFATATVVTAVVASTAATAPTRASSPRSSPIAPASDSADNHIDYVVAVSVDGLNPDVIQKLGAKKLPTIDMLTNQGASTLRARTTYESTSTLPNHTGMVTGLPAAKSYGGHGQLKNSDDGTTIIAETAGRYVESVFSVAHDRGFSTSLYASKPKFNFLNRSWDSKNGAKDRGRDHGRDKIDRYVMNETESKVTARVVADLKSTPSRFSFVHLAEPDNAGHKYGYMTSRYLSAVERSDAQVGQILAAVKGSKKLRGRTAVILTTDHGGLGKSHSDEKKSVNFVIPFFVWGHGIKKADLYRLNPDYKQPSSSSRPSWSASTQPIRNGAVANLVLDLLDLPAVPGSTVNPRQTLDVFAK